MNPNDSIFTSRTAWMPQVVLVTLFTWLGGVMPASAGSQPVCVPPAGGISAWFPGDDTRNVFGNAPGALIGDAQIVPGFRGNAFEFDGLNDSVSVPGTAGLDLQEFTVEAWIQRRATDRVGNDGPAVLMSGNGGAWAFAISAYFAAPSTRPQNSTKSPTFNC